MMFIPFFRHRYPVLSSIGHVLTAPALLVFLYLHMSSQKSASSVFILCIGAMFCCVHFAQLVTSAIQILRRFPSQLECGQDDPTKSFLNLRVQLRGASPIRAGDYFQVYTRPLWCLQSFKLPVAWWETETSSPGLTTTSIISFIPRSGLLTAKLLLARTAAIPVYVDGPYGRRTNLEDYGTVVLIATNNGIVTQLAHFKQVLEQRNNGVCRTVALVLIWQFDTIRE